MVIVAEKYHSSRTWSSNLQWPRATKSNLVITACHLAPDAAKHHAQLAEVNHSKELFALEETS
jgi:hypothetical protein